MKKIFLVLLVGMFMISCVSAGTWGDGYENKVYDEIDDSSINGGLWSTSITGIAGGGAYGENTDYLYANAGGSEGGGSTTTTVSSNDFDRTLAQNITIRATLTEIGSSGTHRARLNVFGNTIKELTDGSDTSTWTFIINGTDWDVYDDGVYQETITPSSNVIQAYAYRDDGYGSGDWAYSRIHYVYYYGSDGNSYVSLNSPEDEYISQTNEVTFNGSALVIGGATITNMSLWTNETGDWALRNTHNIVGDVTNTATFTPTENTSTVGTNQEAYFVSVKNFTINSFVNNVSGRVRSTGGDGYVNITFIYDDGTSYSYSNSMSGTGNNDPYTIVNTNTSKFVSYIRMYLKHANQDAWTYENETVINTFGSLETFTRTITEPIIWNVQACDSDGDCGFSSSNYSLSIDTNAPTINLETPSTILDYGAIDQAQQLNVTFTDTNLDSCWYNYNGTNITIDGCLTGIKNSTTFTLEDGNTDITIYANDTAGNLNSEYTSWSYRILENSRTHNTTSYETARETFSTNITANSSLTAVSLNYNGTYYTATKSGTVWSYSMDIPTTSLGNNSISWRYTYSGDTINSDYTSYQNVSPINLTYCTSGTPYINFTFKDESDDSVINATIPGSTFNYYLGSGDVYKTLSYINATAHYSYAFCFTPNTEPLNLDYRMQYQSEGYPQRIAEPDTLTVNGTTTDKILYLLNTVDGIYVTFQVINTADILISDVDVTATREIASEDVVVATGTTGASGAVTFWLNPDFVHDFVFSKAGYTTYEYSDTPTQTSYTITLSSGDGTTNSSYEGVEWEIQPSDDYLNNDTEYTFAFSLTSTVRDVSEYGFNLRLANGSIISGGSTAVEGTNLTLTYNTSNQSVIYMDYYWVMDGNYTNRSTSWIVFNSENTGWSLSYFFTDLGTVLDSEVFGIDNFGRTLIVFLILFISVGIMSFKYGFTSPISITSMIFAIILFMDVFTPIMPDVAGMSNLPTFLAGILLFLVIFNEVRIR